MPSTYVSRITQHDYCTASQTIVNQTSKPLNCNPLPRLDKELPNHDRDTRSETHPQDDQRLHYQIYELTTPMQPGESRAMQ